MKRLDILQRIDRLQDEHETADKKRRKEIDREIAHLGEQLIIPRRQRKVNTILNKGKHMSFTDIEYLMNQGYYLKDIAKAVGMNKDKLGQMLREKGIDTRVRQYQ